MASYGHYVYNFDNMANASQKNGFDNTSTPNTDNMDFNTNFNTFDTGSLFDFDIPDLNSSGNTPRGFQPAPNRGSQFFHRNPLLTGAMKSHIMDPALPTMGPGFDPMTPLNVSNASGFSPNGQDTKQAFSHRDLYHHQGAFMGLGDNHVSPVDYSMVPQGTLNNHYPSPDDLENIYFPVSQEQATGNFSQAKNIIFTPGNTQPNNTSGVVSTLRQDINQYSSSSTTTSAAAAAAVPTPVSAPAPTSPAKRGRKRKASSDAELDAAAQGKAQPQRPAKKLRLNACQHCRKQKVKCDGQIGKPCSKCTKAGKECIIDGQDHRTKQTNFADISDKLERKRYLELECMGLIIRVTATKARFDWFKSFWKCNPNASQALIALSAWNEPPLPPSELSQPGMGMTDEYFATCGQDYQSCGLRQIHDKLKSKISEEKVMVKDMRPLKNQLKKASRWVLAQAYRALDTLSQQEANAVVGGSRYDGFLDWMRSDLGQMDLSDNAHALNKNYLKAQARGQKLNPTYLKALCGEWRMKRECINLAQGQLILPSSSRNASVPLDEQSPQGPQPKVTPQEHFTSQMQQAAIRSPLVEGQALEVQNDTVMTEPQSSGDDQAMPSEDQQLYEQLGVELGHITAARPLSEDELALTEQYDAMMTNDDSAEQSNTLEESEISEEE